MPKILKRVGILKTEREMHKIGLYGHDCPNDFTIYDVEQIVNKIENVATEIEQVATNLRPLTSEQKEKLKEITDRLDWIGWEFKKTLL